MTNLFAGRSLDGLIAKEVLQWEVVNPCSNFYGNVSRPKKNNLNEDIAYVANCICHVCPVIYEPDGQNDHYAEILTRQNIAEHEGDVAIWGHNRSCLELVPKFSTDWSDIEIVIRTLRERGYYFSLEAPIVDGQQPGWLATFEFNFINYTGGAETAPHAICLAALGAVRGKNHV